MISHKIKIKVEDMSYEIDKGLSLYYERLEKCRILTKDEEFAIAKEIEAIKHIKPKDELQDRLYYVLKKRNEKLRSLLVDSCLKLVVKLAKKYVGFGMPLFDLIQEGNIGLITAVDKFKYQMDCRLTTLASWWIKQSIVRALATKARMIRLPNRQNEKLLQILKLQREYFQEFGKDPSNAYLARFFRMEEVEISLILNSSRMISLNSKGKGQNQEDSSELIDYIDCNEDSLEDSFIEKFTHEEIEKMLNLLSEKERTVIILRFGLFGFDRHSLKSIANKLSVSNETVRQWEIRVIKRLDCEISRGLV